MMRFIITCLGYILLLWGCQTTTTETHSSGNSDLAAHADITASETNRASGSGSLVINEVVAAASADGPDWFELLAVGDGLVDLSRYKVGTVTAMREGVHRKWDAISR